MILLFSLKSLFMLSYQSKSEIRSEIASKIQGVKSLNSSQLQIEMQQCDHCIDNQIPLHIETYAKHLTGECNSRNIKDKLKKLNLEVTYKLGVLRYRDALQDELRKR